MAYHENGAPGGIGDTIRIGVYDPTDWHLKNVIGPLDLTTKWLLHLTAPSFMAATNSRGANGERGEVIQLNGNGTPNAVFVEPFSPPNHYAKRLGESWADSAGYIYYAYQDGATDSTWVLNKVDGIGRILRQWTWTTEDGEFRGDGFDGAANLLVVNRAGTVAYISCGGQFGDFPTDSPRNDFMHRLDLTTGLWLPKLNLPYITGDLPRPVTGFTLQVESFNEDQDGNLWIAADYPTDVHLRLGDHAVSVINPNTGVLIRKWAVPGIQSAAPAGAYVSGDAAELDGIDINGAMDTVALIPNTSIGNPINSNFPVLIRHAVDGGFITNISSIPGVTHTTSFPLGVCFARGNSPALPQALFGGGQPMAQW